MMRLVVAPHGDDESMGCGGLLAKYPGECAVVVMTTMRRNRSQEFSAAMTVLRVPVSAQWQLAFPDGSLGDHMAEAVSMLDKVMTMCRPDEVYLPFPSLHQDHIAAYEAGMRSCRLSMNDAHWFPPSVLVYDIAVYDVGLYPSDLRWNVFESLTEEQVRRKADGLACYWSQAMEGAHPVNGVQQLAHSVGAARRVAFAEQYALVRQVR